MSRITPLQILMKWRKYIRTTYKAVKLIIPNAEIYTTEGVVEDRLTVKSDIDLLIVLPHTPTFNEAIELRSRILKEAEKLGLLLYAPIELHIIGKKNLRNT